MNVGQGRAYDLDLESLLASPPKPHDGWLGRVLWLSSMRYATRGPRHRALRRALRSGSQRRPRAAPSGVAGSLWQAVLTAVLEFPKNRAYPIHLDFLLNQLINSSTNPVRRAEYPGCVLVHYVMSTVWNSLGT